MEQENLNNLYDDDLFEHYCIVADKGQQMMRVDLFLLEKLANVSRNKIQQALEAGTITVNDKLVKPNYKVRPLDVIRVYMTEPKRLEEIIPEPIPLDIVYEDDDLVIINKEAGMVVHPAYQNWTGTLVNALAYHFTNLPKRVNGDGHPGLVHRIDKDTSGLLVVAKSERAMESLSRQFAAHTIERTYYALVWGVPEPKQGTIHTKLARSERDRRVVTALPLDADYGKEAITHYKVIKNFHYVSLVQCNLETGRTHQIRAHMKHIGHPLFNDAAYGGDIILKGSLFSKYRNFVENCFQVMPRQALHAKSLGFEHPGTKQWIQFDSELPADFKILLVKWENYVSYTEKGSIEGELIDLI
jgi:23S rRNA pseudouridine1911/1915/1917 synthase